MANLILRNNRYTAVLMIPKELQKTFGKTRFSQALNTGDPKKANLMAAHYVVMWKAQIEKARGNRGFLAQEMQNWQASFNEQTKAIESQPAGTLRDGLEVALEVLTDQFNDHLRTLPDSQAYTLQGLVEGTRTLTADYIDPWLKRQKERKIIQKTIDQQSRDILILAERFLTLEEVTAVEVKKLLNELDSQGKGVKRYLDSFKSFWKYLKINDLVPLDSSPFDNQLALKFEQNKADKAKDNEDRKPFTPEQTVELWTLAKAKGDDKLADLIALGAYTGARIEEIGALKIDDVTDTYFLIATGKKRNVFREVPIHSALMPLVNRLKARSKDGYLLTELEPNMYGARAGAVGKRFGRLKTKAGYGKDHVFHSFRKTLITLLEQAGIPENFCCDIVGHEKGTMGYGRYSGGASIVNKKEAIEKIRYPFPIDCF